MLLSQSHHLIPLIYASIDDQAAWKTFLSAFADSFRAQHSVITILSPAYPDAGITAFAGPAATEELLREYYEKWSHHDPWISGRDMSVYGDGIVVPSQVICPDSELEELEIYRAFLKPNGFHYGGGVRLATGSGQMLAHSFSRPKEVGPLTDDELALWQSLVPHLKRAVEIQGSLQALQEECDIFRAAFTRHRGGLVLLNKASTIVYSNPAAEALLSKGHDLAIVQTALGPQLRATNPEFAKCLRAGIQGAGQGSDSPFPSRTELLLERTTDDLSYRPLLIQIAPLQSAEAIHSLSRATVIVRIIDPEAGPTPSSNLLRNLFALTDAEAEFCVHLAAGLTLDEIAATRFISTHTVRSHLKSALRKTGTNRQAELVALLHRTAAQDQTDDVASKSIK